MASVITNVTSSLQSLVDKVEERFESQCCIGVGPGYASPKEAMKGPREALLYVTAVYTGTGREKPDYLATVDVDPTSPTYSKLVHRLPVTNFGDELHHSGWNACSSCHGDASAQRRYLILPSLVSGRIYAIDTAKDPRAPVIYKTVEPEVILSKTGLAYPHTAHCLASGDILISCLGGKNGNAEGNGFLLLDSDLNVKGSLSLVSMGGKFVVTVTQFLYFSYTDKHIDWRDFQILCSDLPIPDDSGCIFRNPKAKLVPASISKWAKLFESNPWAKHGLVALSRDYLKPPPCAYGLKGEDDLESFIRNDLGAVDIPFLRPLDVAMPGLSFPLEKEKVFLLLQWIQHLTVNYQTLPEVFKRSIAEGRWLRTHKGYQSPRVSFLFNSEWKSAGFQLKDLPFINNSFYGKTMDDFKRALQEMGVVVEFGKGCDLITEHLQMHTELQVITRLYKYLHRFHWKPTDSNPVKIWIPLDGGLGGEWKDSKLCAVHDDNGLFHNRLEILDNFYEEALLPFFSSYLGVALHPRIEDYCSLWLNWVSTGHQVSAGECCSIWRNILKHWTSSSEKIKRCLWKGPLRLPAYTSIEDIQLSAPNETFIPDDLKLKELFMRASASPKFAWHPNPSDPEIPLDSLFSTYIHLGAQNISQATEKADISVSSNISLRKIPAGKGMVKVGLYRIILSYLARPSFKLSPDKRHQIVSTLVESTVYEVAEPFTIEYSLSLPAGNGVAETVKARTTSLVRWEKNKGRILIHVSDTHNRKENMSLATDLAEVISAGLLSNYPDLVAGLCEMVKIGCILGFDDDAVNYMLQCNNFQMFVEDKSFLACHFPEVNESVLPSKELRGFYGCSSGGRKSISSPAKATRSTGYFSVDCPKRWEKNLFSLKQEIINVEESTSDSMKKKLVRLLFPLGTADIGQLNNCLLKLIGDAHLKILIILEALGGNEISGMVPLKLDDLLCSPELKKHLGGSEKTEQTSSSSPSSSGNDEVDVETLKAAVGAMVLNYYGKEGERQQI